MQVLILSCNTGEGHNSAAKAIKDRFDFHGHDAVIKDALCFWSPEISKVISKSHIFIYRRLPKLFGIGYRFEENHPPKEGEESLKYELVIRGSESLYEYLKTVGYDAIICTHVFSAMMVTEIKRRYHYNVKSYFVATDYTCSPGVAESSLDTYFIPHPALTDEFVSCGVEREKIEPFGIPVRQEFYNQVSAVKAKKTLGLSEEKDIILLACGSMGCGPIKEITDYFAENIEKSAMLVVIAGSNRKLYKSLGKYRECENVKILGYTTRMSIYMDAATVILTKPGGLSSTEAAVKGLPMIFINAVPGCETRNIEFFEKNGFACKRDSTPALLKEVEAYLNNPEKRKEKRKQLKKDFSGNAAEKIYEYVIKCD